jgi:hydrogenase expression/formation protein HypE
MSSKPPTVQNTGADTLGILFGSCPLPISNHKEIVLGHGSGGKMSHELMQKLILPLFKNQFLEPLHDGAVVPLNGIKLAFSTDSYVVNPLFFPGGDIGKLAVCGTVNDLAMCGATPKYLSVGLILEEGVAVDDVWRVLKSMRETADEAGVSLVTGDTKVVERGKGDKIFINTSGIGLVDASVQVHPGSAVAGDKIIINGPIAMHGIAIMSAREELNFETEIVSDCTPLNSLVASILRAFPGVHVMRDPTRGGVASALNEIAETSRIGIHLHEAAIPISEEVKGACEILGFDPLYVANEGKLLVIVPGDAAERVLNAMRAHSDGHDSAIIGEVVENHPGFVTMRTRIGGNRVVDMLSGEQLPRIC